MIKLTLKRGPKDPSEREEKVQQPQRYQDNEPDSGADDNVEEPILVRFIKKRALDLPVGKACSAEHALLSDCCLGSWVGKGRTSFVI